MELLVKNKFGSITGASKVLDEKGEQVYKVKGSFASNAFSKKHKKKIMTMDKKLLYTVADKRLHGLLKRSCIIYDANKKEIARIAQNGAFKCGFEITGATEKMEIVGTFLSHDGASIMLGGKKIGSIINGNLKKTKNDKAILTMGFTDKYRLVFNDKEDGPFLVAIIIAIDNMHDADKRRASRNYHSTTIGG